MLKTHKVERMLFNIERINIKLNQITANNNMPKKNII